MAKKSKVTIVIERNNSKRGKSSAEDLQILLKARRNAHAHGHKSGKKGYDRKNNKALVA